LAFFDLISDNYPISEDYGPWRPKKARSGNSEFERVNWQAQTLPSPSPNCNNSGLVGASTRKQKAKLIDISDKFWLIFYRSKVT
jgi:hypothetical protein